MARRALAGALLACLLAGCGEPVFVPEAGPGAPGYTERPAPPPPDVRVVQEVTQKTLPAGGQIDGVAREDGSLEVTGWALLGDRTGGRLRIVLPSGEEAEVRSVESVARPDVVEATGNPALLWSGFSVVLDGSLPADTAVCVLSRSKQGAYRLNGSDDTLCPA